MNKTNAVGRRREINLVLRSLQSNSLIEINGIIGIGKTYFLRRVKQFIDNTGKYISIFIDSPFGINAIDAIKDAVYSLSILSNSKNPNLESLNDALNALKKLSDEINKDLVFIFDDFHDYISQEMKDIISGLLSMKFKVIFSSINPTHFSSKKICLSPLNKETTYNLSLERLRNSITKDGLLEIYNLTGGIPRYIDILISELMKFNLRSRVEINNGIVRSVFDKELRGGLLRIQAIHNIRTYIYLFGKQFMNILTNKMNPHKVSRRLIRKLLTIGLIEETEKNGIHIIDPILRRVISSYSINLRPTNESYRRHRIESKLRKLFRNYTFINDSLRVFQSGLLFQVSPKIRREDIDNFIRIKQILNAKYGFYLLPKAAENENLKNPINGIKIIFIESKNESELINKSIPIIESIIRKYSDSQQNP